MARPAPPEPLLREVRGGGTVSPPPRGGQEGSGHTGETGAEGAVSEDVVSKMLGLRARALGRGRRGEGRLKAPPARPPSQRKTRPGCALPALRGGGWGHA